MLIFSALFQFQFTCYQTEHSSIRTGVGLQVSADHVHAWWPPRAGRVSDSLGLNLKMVVNHLGPLEEQPGLLTDELSLQLPPTKQIKH